MEIIGIKVLLYNIEIYSKLWGIELNLKDPSLYKRDSRLYDRKAAMMINFLTVKGNIVIGYVKSNKFFCYFSAAFAKIL